MIQWHPCIIQDNPRSGSELLTVSSKQNIYFLITSKRFFLFGHVEAFISGVTFSNQKAQFNNQKTKINTRKAKAFCWLFKFTPEFVDFGTKISIAIYWWRCLCFTTDNPPSFRLHLLITVCPRTFCVLKKGKRNYVQLKKKKKKKRNFV